MNLGQVIAGVACAAVAAEGAFAVAAKSNNLLRPPGAQGEADFMARCIKCGKCIEACPYATLHVADALQGAAAGTPCITARDQACRLCEDFPCVNACPTGALRDVAARSDVNMGYAVINEDICIAYLGLRCEVCYRTCPLIDQAITIDYRQNESDSIHSIFAPIIDRNVCTGCGLCVERCTVDEPSVAIRIVTRAEQGK